MILDKQSEVLELTSGDIGETVKMEIDAESHIFLMKMLSKFYSDAIGSTIRETVSNALDSHREVGCKDPIVVRFKYSNTNMEFSVEDFGIGMDTDAVTNIISKYGKSTKRNSTTQLGAFGLGFKSPLAYTPSFYFIGRKNGIERKWMMYESETEANNIDLLHEKPTIERNGLKVIIPVKNNDYTNFLTKIKEQLAYFEDVYFEVEGISNDYIKIYRETDFQFSNLSRDTNMHISLDNVYYPIDWSKLGMGTIGFPLAIRFSLTDGIFPTPNRESIKYTDSAKEIIKAKIKQIATWFIKKYNETLVDVDDIHKIFLHFQNSDRKLTVGHETFYCSRITSLSTVKIGDPKLKGLKVLDSQSIYNIREYILGQYQAHYMLINERFQYLKTPETLAVWKLRDYSIYIYDEDVSVLKKAYIKDTKASRCLLVKKTKPLKLRGKNTWTNDNWHTILNLRGRPKNTWRTCIQDAQYALSLMTKDFVDLDKLVIPQTWIDARRKAIAEKSKATRQLEKKAILEGVTSCLKARDLYKWSYDSNCRFERTTVDMSKAERIKSYVVYGTPDDQVEMDKWYPILETRGVELMVFSQREIKKLDKISLHNWIKFENFVKGNNRLYKRIFTGILIKRFIAGNKGLFELMSIGSLSQLSKGLADDLSLLSTYANKYKIDSKLEEGIVANGIKNKLYDPRILNIYVRVSNKLAKHPYISKFYNLCDVGVYGEHTLLRDIMKYNKFRMDWKNYKLPDNGQPVGIGTETGTDD